MLQQELSCFNTKKNEMLAKYPEGGFVVIKDNDFLGVFQTRNDALSKGLAEYGNVQFLVKPLHEEHRTVNYIDK